MSNDFGIGYYLVAFPAVERGNWHTPDALARNTPVRPAFQHVAHAFTAPGRNPFDSLVNFAQRHRSQSRPIEDFSVSKVAGEIGSIAAIFIFLNIAVAAPVHRNEPLGRGAKNHWILTAPAVRIAMIVLFTEQEYAPLAHEIDDLWIGCKDTQPGEMLDLKREPAGVIDRTINFQAVLLADHEIVMAVPWRGVHTASAGFARPRFRTCFADIEFSFSISFAAERHMFTYHQE